MPAKAQPDVEGILKDLNLGEKPKLLVFNKIDKLPSDTVDRILPRYEATAVSAIRPESMRPLLGAIETYIWESRNGPRKSAAAENTDT